MKPPSILRGAGSESHRLLDVWWLLIVLAALVVLLVLGLIVVALLRKGTGRIDENHWIVAGGVVLPVVILTVLAGATVQATADLRTVKTSEVHVEVTGKRWWWDVRYPDAHVVTANEIHVPVGTALDIGLDSDNVIHSFWLPDLAGKVDLIPGQHNELRFKVRTPGRYRGLCAEYCGLQHAKMQFLLVAEPRAQFDAWLRRQAASATPDATFESSACAGCHTVRGTEARGTKGPDLTHVATRAFLAGNTVDNDTASMRDWVTHPQSLKPGALMPDVPLSATELDAILAYLRELR